MPINIVERAITPYNEPTSRLVQRDRYYLFAPIAGLNKIGLAGFNPKHFAVHNGIVELIAGSGGSGGSDNLISGEAYNATQSLVSEASANSATALSIDTRAGAKAFSVLNINNSTKQYTLDSVEGLKVGMIYSVHLKHSQGSAQKDLVGKIEHISGNIVTVDIFFNVPPGTTFKSINTLSEVDLASELNTFRIPAEPNLGTRDVGYGAFSVGWRSRALSKGAFASGVDTLAHGAWAHAEGHTTEASYSAHAEGKETKAVGQVSHAEGLSTTARGLQSHAEGYKTEATEDSSHAEGTFTHSTGNSSHAEGYNTIASGFSSHAEGYNTVAKGSNSHAEGYRSTSEKTTENCGAHGSNSHSEGQNTFASAENAHTEGRLTIASGLNSHAEGDDTRAKGEHTHAEGRRTQAVGNISHAEGQSDNCPTHSSSSEYISAWNNSKNFAAAIGQGAHVEGCNGLAAGIWSHVEGNKCYAGGEVSHAGGYNSYANGAKSFAHGQMVKADQEAQFAVGKYNAANSEAIFMVGGGNSDSDRKNAFEVISDRAGFKIKIGNTTLSEAQLQQLLNWIS